MNQNREQVESNKVDRASNGSVFGGMVDLAEFIATVIPRVKKIREISKDNKKRRAALNKRREKNTK